MREMPLADVENLVGGAFIQCFAGAFRWAYQTSFVLGSERPGVRTVGLIISDRHRFAYYLIPKVATQSTIRGLYREASPELETCYLNCPAGTFPRAKPEDYFKFAIVRNPWSRTVSCYKDKILTANNFNKLNIISKFKGLRPQMPFDDFVVWLGSDEGRDEYADGHWCSQHVFLSNQAGQVELDFVGTLENMDQDIKRVSEKLSVDLIIEHRHKSKDLVTKQVEKKYNHMKDLLIMPYRRFYNKRTIVLIGERYKKDIELFGYDF